MTLLFSPDAFEDFPHHDIERLKKKIDWLWVNRTLVRHVPLRWDLSGYFKRRLGNYRIIYTQIERFFSKILRKTYLQGDRNSL
jgi:mRNA-degrading endonuclease RelE of RelBE toxin-antitoxin system